MRDLAPSGCDSFQHQVVVSRGLRPPTTLCNPSGCARSVNYVITGRLGEGRQPRPKRKYRLLHSQEGIHLSDKVNKGFAAELGCA